MAWEPLGWKAAWFSEIEPFPSAVLKYHYANVPNLGDMTALPARIRAGEVDAPDILCGGTPCQAFSVAGLRQSLDDARGNLSLIFCELADAIDDVRSVRGDPPVIVFWENVPGVLSTKDNAFGCFLAGLAGEDDALISPGGRWSNAGWVSGPKRAVAWRTLDAQYFGLAQRRKRVFVVASARDRFDPASILFESEGLRRDTAPSREPGKDTAGSTGDGIARCITAGKMKRQDWETCNMVAHTLRGEGFDASEDGTGRRTPLVPVAFVQNSRDEIRLMGGDGGIVGALAAETGAKQQCYVAHPYTLALRGRNGLPQLEFRQDGTANALLTPNGGRGGIGIGAIAFPANLSGTQCASAEDIAPSMGAKNPTAVAVDTYNHTITGDYTGSLTTTGGPPLSGPGVMQAMQVRRLTPVECERLQGFHEGYTAIPWRNKPADECPDGPRYKALGNSWAVPVVRWIGQRIHNAMSQGAA